MWRRTYLLLILVRLYFAFSPSYLHPDENFQGPEVIAGKKLEFSLLSPVVFELLDIFISGTEGQLVSQC
jgi:phosphatidylinositol glycan class Z